MSSEDRRQEGGPVLADMPQASPHLKRRWTELLALGGSVGSERVKVVGLFMSFWFGRRRSKDTYLPWHRVQREDARDAGEEHHGG